MSILSYCFLFMILLNHDTDCEDKLQNEELRLASYLDSQYNLRLTQTSN